MQRRGLWTGRAHHTTRVVRSPRATLGAASTFGCLSRLTRGGYRLLQATSTRIRRARPLPALVMPPRLTLSPVGLSRARDPDSPSARADFEGGTDRRSRLAPRPPQMRSIPRRACRAATTSASDHSGTASRVRGVTKAQSRSAGSSTRSEIRSEPLHPIATRYERTALSFAAMLFFGTMIWLRRMSSGPKDGGVDVPAH